MENEVKNALENFLSNTTIDGVCNVMKSKRYFHKIIWLLCLICCVSIGCWFVILIILKFTSFEVVINIESSLETPVEFPTVTICSRDQCSFNEKHLTDLISECTFNYDKSCQTNPDNYFESVFVPHDGICLKFNSGKNMSNQTVPILNSTIGGRDDSLNLQIFSPAGLYKLLFSYFV